MPDEEDRLPSSRPAPAQLTVSELPGCPHGFHAAPPLSTCLARECHDVGSRRPPTNIKKSCSCARGVHGSACRATAGPSSRSMTFGAQMQGCRAQLLDGKATAQVWALPRWARSASSSRDVALAAPRQSSD